MPSPTINNSATSSVSTDSELALLERVKAAESAEERLTQRELARASGLSLGMTNILVRRLVARGWLALRRHSAKSISYLLTPEGVAEVARRSTERLHRATRVVSAFGFRLESFLVSAKSDGAKSVVMVGRSDFFPLLEDICDRLKLGLLQSSDPERALALEAKGGIALVWGDTGKEYYEPVKGHGFDLGEAVVQQGGIL